MRGRRLNPYYWRRIFFLDSAFVSSLGGYCLKYNALITNQWTYVALFFFFIFVSHYVLNKGTLYDLMNVIDLRFRHIGYKLQKMYISYQ